MTCAESGITMRMTKQTMFHKCILFQAPKCFINTLTQDIKETNEVKSFLKKLSAWYFILEITKTFIIHKSNTVVFLLEVSLIVDPLYVYLYDCWW